ncbi:MAG: hypothetical protein JW917_03490 [Ignavibacteria bacterium]|nr:hypothetical protein [Ignavibacteria bacterium]
MINLLRLSILILIIIFFSQNSFSQFLYFGPSAGISLPTGDFGGNSKDYYGGQKYGLKLGPNFGAEARLVTPVVNVKGYFRYSLFKGSGDALPNKGYIETKKYVSEFGIGPEYMLVLPSLRVKPHIDILFIYSVFSGSTELKDISDEQDGFYNMVSTSRTGFGIGAGAEIKLKKFNLDFSLRYSILNFLRKSYEVGNCRIDTYNSLNDGTDPLFDGIDLNHPVGKDRNISLFQFNVSIIYGINF